MKLFNKISILLLISILSIVLVACSSEAIPKDKSKIKYIPEDKYYNFYLNPKKYVKSGLDTEGVIFDIFKQNDKLKGFTTFNISGNDLVLSVEIDTTDVDVIVNESDYIKYKGIVTGIYQDIDKSGKPYTIPSLKIFEVEVVE